MGRVRMKRPKGRLPKLRRPRISRLTRTRAGAWAGGGLISSGVGLEWGLPIALIVAGTLLAAYCLLIAEVADPNPGERRPRTW